jgi:hypothetical protein
MNYKQELKSRLESQKEEKILVKTLVNDHDVVMEEYLSNLRINRD